MSSQSPNQQLSPPQRFKTNIKAPERKNQVLSNENGDEGGFITVDVCSEFAPYRASLEYVKKSSKIKLLHSKAGLPIILSLTEDMSLSLLQHGIAATEGWSFLDITPPGKRVTTFDVVKLAQTLFIAVSCQDTSTKVPYHDLYYAQVDADPAGLAKLGGSMEKNQTWIKVEDNVIEPVGGLIHSSLFCRPTPPKEPHSAPGIEVVVGTKATPGTGGKFGTLYCVNPKALPERHWHILSFPGAASELLQADNLTIGPVDGSNTEVGMVSVFEDFAKDAKARVVGHINDATGGVGRTFEFKTGKLGGSYIESANLKRFCSRTDIFIAAEKGIGFYTGLPNQSRVDMLTGDPILPEISFQQVFCSESVDPANPQKQTKIAIFAVSDDKSLYYIEGRRLYDTRTVVFEASGLPIRRGVVHMSTTYSAIRGTSELLYALEDENALLYLRREPNGQFWLEDKVLHRARKLSSYDAFVTSIALKDGSGNQLEAGFPINLKGEFTQVVSNGRSFTLNPTTPTTVYTDAMGCIEIIQASQRQLACPPVNVELSSPGATEHEGPYAFDVTSSSRIDNLLSDITDANSLESALSDGKGGPFTGNGVQEAGQILGQINGMKIALRNTNASGTESAYQAQESHTLDFGSTVLNFLGDCIEAMKTVVKKAVKVVIQVVGPVIRVFFTILGKVFKFVIKTAFSLFKVVGNLLEDYLGFDGLNRLLDYLKMVFDPESVRKTQQVLRGAITGCLDLTGRFLEVNKNSISDMFEDGKTFLQSFLDDPRQPSQGTVGDIINQILNNPVVRLLMKINPLQWIMEAVKEELPDFQIPPFAETINKVISSFGNAVDKEVKVLDQLLANFTSESQQLFADRSPESIKRSIRRMLQSMGWALFDTIRNIFESIYDTLTLLFQSMSSILDGVWKLPGITDMWEELTDQEFTLLGLVTYLPAVLLNFVSIGAQGKLPFDGFELPDFEAIKIRPFYRSRTKTGSHSPDGKRPLSPNSGPSFSSNDSSIAHDSAEKDGPKDLNMSSAMGISFMASGSDRFLPSNTSSGFLQFSSFVTIVSYLGRIFNAAGRFFQVHNDLDKAVNPNIDAGGGGGVGEGGPVGLIEQALTRFATWMPNVGRFIGAAGNVALVAWHMTENPDASLAPSIVMLVASLSEAVIVGIELRNGNTQALRLIGEILGRGTSIATTVLQDDWEFGLGTVAVVASSLGGIGGEAARLWNSPEALIAAGMGHGVDFVFCCAFLVSVVIPFQSDGNRIK
ncbi:unnamed protein product [Fusarium equiseti]|uniref:Uncharacterized protein n=1 Tax=Fusarium equiseti TaxID=61235 RepID=A0A8J2IU54_FUSEQ|nr:unnamed protein product [Fusarium equiseti]